MSAWSSRRRPLIGSLQADRARGASRGRLRGRRQGAGGFRRSTARRGRSRRLRLPSGSMTAGCIRGRSANQTICGRDRPPPQHDAGDARGVRGGVRRDPAARGVAHATGAAVGEDAAHRLRRRCMGRGHDACHDRRTSRRDGGPRRDESSGVPFEELRASDPEGPAGTQLNRCMKVYVPVPGGPHGMVFQIGRQRGGKLGLAYLAFVLRHLARDTEGCPPHRAGTE